MAPTIAVTARPRVLTVSVTASVIARAVCCCFWAMRPAKSSSKKLKRLAEGVAVQPRQHQRVEVRAERQRVQRRAEAHEARAQHQEEGGGGEQQRPGLGEQPLGPARLGEVDQPADDAGGADLGDADGDRDDERRSRSPGRRRRSAQRKNGQSRSGGGPSARAKASIRSARGLMRAAPGKRGALRARNARDIPAFHCSDLDSSSINCKEPRHTTLEGESPAAPSRPAPDAGQRPPAPGRPLGGRPRACRCPLTGGCLVRAGNAQVCARCRVVWQGRREPLDGAGHSAASRGSRRTGGSRGGRRGRRGRAASRVAALLDDACPPSSTTIRSMRAMVESRCAMAMTVLPCITR